MNIIYCMPVGNFVLFSMIRYLFVYVFRTCFPEPLFINLSNEMTLPHVVGALTHASSHLVNFLRSKNELNYMLFLN